MILGAYRKFWALIIVILSPCLLGGQELAYPDLSSGKKVYLVMTRDPKFRSKVLAAIRHEKRWTVVNNPEVADLLFVISHAHLESGEELHIKTRRVPFTHETETKITEEPGGSTSLTLAVYNAQNRRQIWVAEASVEGSKTKSLIPDLFKSLDRAVTATRSQ